MYPTNSLSTAVCYSFKTAGSSKNSSSVRAVQQHMLSKMQVSTQPAEKRKTIQTCKSWYSNSFSREHQTKTPGFPYTLSTPCSLATAANSRQASSTGLMFSKATLEVQILSWNFLFSTPHFPSLTL